MRESERTFFLDNGILNWCYAAILSALEGNEEPLAKAVTEKIHSLLARQKLELFLDQGAHLPVIMKAGQFHKNELK